MIIALSSYKGHLMSEPTKQARTRTRTTIEANQARSVKPIIIIIITFSIHKILQLF